MSCGTRNVGANASSPSHVSAPDVAPIWRILRTVIAEPISHSLHLDHLVGAGVGTVTVLSVAVLVLISFAAGIIARTAAGRRITRWSENSFLSRFPHYQVIKSMAEGLAHIEHTSGLKPALINIEGGWQIGYLLEHLENDWVVVFLPQAPSPMSGNVMYMPG